MNFSACPERRILVYGDSNTYGYDPLTGMRYGEADRYARILARLLGEDTIVLEEGLPGRTTVFDDPLTEGLCGLHLITPIMLSHMPLDTLVVMLGTNDTKERFGCNATNIAKGMARLVDKAFTTPAWRGEPSIVVVCPPPIAPHYADKACCAGMGRGCDTKSQQLPRCYQEVCAEKGVAFLDAGAIPGMGMSPLDGMHLSRESNRLLAGALFDMLRL